MIFVCPAFRSFQLMCIFPSSIRYAYLTVIFDPQNADTIYISDHDNNNHDNKIAYRIFLCI